MTRISAFRKFRMNINGYPNLTFTFVNTDLRTTRFSSHFSQFVYGAFTATTIKSIPPVFTRKNKIAHLFFYHESILDKTATFRTREMTSDARKQYFN